MEQYQKFDDRIVIINTPHNTAALTRNIGIDAANGKYIMFIDSDDYISSIMVENMVEQIEKTQAEVLVTDYVSLNFRKDLHDDKYNRYFQSPIEGMFEGSVFIDTNDIRNYLWFTVTCWNKIYLTEFLKSKNIKFPPEFPIFEDWLFWVDVFFNTKKLYYYRKCYYYYRRRRKGSLMSKKDETVYWLIPLYKNAREIFKIIDASDKILYKPSWLAAALSTWESPDFSTIIANRFSKPLPRWQSLSFRHYFY